MSDRSGFSLMGYNIRDMPKSMNLIILIAFVAFFSFVIMYGLKELKKSDNGRGAIKMAKNRKEEGNLF